MNKIAVGQILSKLNPMNNIPWGFMIYIVIILCIITLFMQKENSPFLISLMLAGAILAGIMEQIAVFTPNFFGAFILRIIMMVFPLVVAGMTKTPKSRGFAIGAALMGGLFLFARWATLPR
jgi:hypothetical protein